MGSLVLDDDIGFRWGFSVCGLIVVGIEGEEKFSMNGNDVLTFVDLVAD